jgi:TP901 family phage tail tape measure protein
MSEDTANITFRVQGEANLNRASKALLQMERTLGQSQTRWDRFARELRDVETASTGFDRASTRAERFARELNDVVAAETRMTTASRQAAVANQQVVPQRTLHSLEKMAVAIHRGELSLEQIEANAYSASRGFAILSQTMVRHPIKAMALLKSSTFAATVGTTRLKVALAGLTEAMTFVAASRFGVIAIMFAAMAGMGAAVRGATTAYRDLDEATRKVLSSMTEVADFMKQYDNIYYDLAKKMIDYGAAVEDIAKIQWELKSAGLSAAEALAGVDTNLKLLYTEVDDIGTATRMTAGIFMTFREELLKTRNEAEAFAYIGDVLAMVMNRSMVDADTLVQGFKHSMSAADAAGLSFEHLAAMIAVLNNNMLFGGIAGRGIRVSLSQLTQDMDVLVGKYGLVVDKAQPFGDQLMSVFSQLNEKIGSGALSIEEFGFWLETAGLRGAPAILALVRNFDDLQEMINYIETGDMEGMLDKIAETNMDSFNVQWKRFANALKLVGAELAKPELSRLGKFFGSVADSGSMAVGWLKIFHAEVQRLKNEDPIAAGGDWFSGLYAREKAFLNMWLDFSEDMDFGDIVEDVTNGAEEIEEAITEMFNALGGGYYVKDLLGTLTFEDVLGEIEATEEAFMSLIDKLKAGDIPTGEEDFNDFIDSIETAKETLEGYYDKLEDISDFQIFKAEFQFDMGEMSEKNYLAVYAEEVEKAKEALDRLQEGDPGYESAFRWYVEAYRDLEKVTEAVKKNQEDITNEVSKSLAALAGVGDNMSDTMLKKRIRYFEALKYTGGAEDVKKYNTILSDLRIKLQDLTGEDQFRHLAIYAMENEKAAKDIEEGVDKVTISTVSWGNAITDIGTVITNTKGDLTNIGEDIIPKITSTLNEGLTPGFQEVVTSTKTFKENLEHSLNLIISMKKNLEGLNMPGGSGASASQHSSIDEALMSGE